MPGQCNSIVIRMKKLLVLFCLLLLIPSGLGLKELLKHEIIVNLDAIGGTKVTERFVLSLDKNAYIVFEDLSKSPQAGVETWNTFLDEIDICVLGERSPVTISTSRIGQGQFGNEVKFEYTISDFATFLGGRGRYVRYSIDGNKFKFYDNVSGIFSIPAKTDLWIKLDPNLAGSKITNAVPEPYQKEDKTARWVGPSTTGTFLINYETEKGIGESFDINRIINLLIETPVYTITILIIIALIIIYRKQIIGLVSESFAGEEEIEMPKREL